MLGEEDLVGGGSEAVNMACLDMRYRRQPGSHQRDSQMLHCPDHNENPISVVISDSVTEH